MLEKLKTVVARFDEVDRSLADPSVINDREKYRTLSKEHSELQPIVQAYQRWQQVQQGIADAKHLLTESTDREMNELARHEIDSLTAEEGQLHEELMMLLLPKDPNDDKNIILEIRAGTGGDEAALFAGDLFTMYSKFSEGQGWRVELLSTSYSTVGGFKEVIAMIRGKGAYSKLKYERGVHRVQRVPKTETQGRIHTSTVTVAVLPEAEDVDIAVADKDLRIDVFRASGPGGQSVNTTDSAVRVMHIPTGLIVTCQDEKSQHKNKAKALTVLRSRLLQLEEEKQAAERQGDRRSQIGTGERSEKIRTYNFPQSRVTDHRIGFTVHQIDEILGGKLNILIDPLTAHYRSEALKSGSEAEATT